MVGDRERLQPLVTLNLRSQIEQEVRNAILNGIYKPGERLVETAIADQLGVSRAPVREVLSALEQEGLVVSVPRRGTFVVDFTDRDIDEIYSLREVLEVGAAERAMYRLTAGQIDELRRILDQLGELTARNADSEAVVRLDLSFHELLCRAADHRRLYAAWNSMRLQTQLLIGLTSKTYQDRPRHPHDVHQALLNAVIAKDLKTVRSLLRDHMEDAQRRARMALQALREGTDRPG